MDFISRLPPIDPYAEGEERWLVRDGGESRVAWLLGHYDGDWLKKMIEATRAWVGFSHPRVSRVVRVGGELAASEPRATFVVGDDRGPSLKDATAQLPADERERWAVAQIAAICDGLAAMRVRAPGFVHRRIEPHRIFVDASGHARLRAPVDTLGIAPAQPGRVGAGRITGTPEFMAPEQATGTPTTPATDVYALAINLVHAVTGRSPYANDNMMQSLMAIIQGPAPTIPGASPALAGVLAKAFAKEPTARFADPAEFAAALRGAVPDADEVDAVISDRIAAWWPTAEQAQGPTDLFGPPCRKQWDELASTGVANVRTCGECRQSVVAVESIAAILPLVGRCVSIRRP